MRFLDRCGNGTLGKWIADANLEFPGRSRFATNHRSSSSRSLISLFCLMYLYESLTNQTWRLAILLRVSRTVSSTRISHDEYINSYRELWILLNYGFRKILRSDFALSINFLLFLMESLNGNIFIVVSISSRKDSKYRGLKYCGFAVKQIICTVVIARMRRKSEEPSKGAISKTSRWLIAKRKLVRSS